MFTDSELINELKRVVMLGKEEAKMGRFREKDILVFEEDLSQGEQIMNVLHESGYTVFYAETFDGWQRLIKLRMDNYTRTCGQVPCFDLMVLSLNENTWASLYDMIPGMKTVKSLSKMKVAALINEKDIGYTSWLLDRGCCGCIIKPVDKIQLLMEVKKCLPDELIDRIGTG